MPTPDTQKERTLKIKLAAVLGLSGLLVLCAVALTSATPRPLWLWAAFAASFVFFEWRAVPVNDRLLASPTMMIAMTAAVVFGPDSALLGVVAMAALGPLTPVDLSERRWFEPVVNFGQMVITVAASISILQLFLPRGGITSGNLWLVALGSGVAAVVYGMVNFNLVQLVVRAVYGNTQVRPWSNLAAILLPSLGMGFLGGLLGAAYHVAGQEILPLIFVVFFVGYMTFASYAQLREAQESTLRGFIKALEAKDLYTRGHTERVAYFAELIGESMGFNGTRLERLRWTALIHDLGKLAVPRDLIRKKARLSDEEYVQMQAHVHLVEDLLAEVSFLQPMVAIATNHHAHYDGNGYHGSHHTHGEAPCIEACILAVADSFDAMTSTRSYRVALSQEYAFGELRRYAGTQFDPEVVETFIATLEARGERYGSPGVDDENEARRLAEEVIALG